MQKRFLVVLFLALLFNPVAAASTTMDPECSYCDLPAWLCICTATLHHASYVSAVLPPEPNHQYSIASHHERTLHVAPNHTDAVEGHALEAQSQSLSEAIRMLNADETAVQRGTVQAHLEDIYTPGYPASQVETRRTRSPRRQAPQRDGYRCNIEDCTKRFDRACDLNRHQKNHLGNSERPHRCTFCQEAFLYPKDLIRHQQKHKGGLVAQSTFYCNEPGCRNTKGFSRHDNLLRHRRSKHTSSFVTQRRHS